MTANPLSAIDTSEASVGDVLTSWVDPVSMDGPMWESEETNRRRNGYRHEHRARMARWGRGVNSLGEE